jgi:hypothetical protein
MLVGRFRFGQLAGLPVHVIVALAGSVDAIGPVQAGVEPLRRIRRHHLLGQHVAQLVVERARVVFGGKVAALPAPIGPAAGEAVEHLLGGELADIALGFGQRGQGLGVRHRTPQPGRHGLFLDLLQASGDAGFAEVLLGEHVGGDLRPEFGHLDIFEAEYHRAVGIADLRCRQSEINPCVG